MPEVLIQPNVQKVPEIKETVPVVTTPSVQSSTYTSSEQDDLVARASAIQPEPKPESQSVESDILEGSGFDRNKWNDLLSKLPQDQKMQLESAYKALQTGAQKKFQKASELTKQAEATRRRPSVAELLQDPDFVREAQAYASVQSSQAAPANSGMTNEQWSVLTDQEKAIINTTQQNQFQLQSQMNRILSEQEDERIKSRYKNYDSSTVNNLQHDLIEGRIQATREHLWKVLDYEDAVQRAYKLGLQDRQSNMHEKQNASSVSNGLNITQVYEPPVKVANESTIDFFRRIATKRMNQAK